MTPPNYSPDDKPSIAELKQQCALVASGKLASSDEIHDAAPVLLEIAAAALALRDAGTEGDEVIRLMQEATNADEYSAACTLAPRVDERRRAALHALNSALAKVRT